MARRDRGAAKVNVRLTTVQARHVASALKMLLDNRRQLGMPVGMFAILRRSWLEIKSALVDAGHVEDDPRQQGGAGDDDSKEGTGTG